MCCLIYMCCLYVCVFCNSTINLITNGVVYMITLYTCLASGVEKTVLYNVLSRGVLVLEGMWGVRLNTFEDAGGLYNKGNGRDWTRGSRKDKDDPDG